MIRSVNIFALSFIICISSILTADVSTADGRSPVPASQFNQLKSQLESTKLGQAFGGNRVRILYIESATQQAMEGTLYHIMAKISFNEQPKSCCFTVHKTDQEFDIQRIQIGAKKC